MADLSRNNADLPTAIIGQTTAGVPTTPVGSDVNGNLLVKDYANGSASPGVAAAVSTLVGGLYNSTQIALTNGQQAALQVDPNGYLIVTNQDDFFGTINVTTQDVASTSIVGNNQQVIYSGTPTAGSAASIVLTSDQGITTEVSGTWTGTLQTEISLDGGNTWVIRPMNQSGTVYLASSFIANFVAGGNIAGYTNFRIRAISAMTGTAIVRFNTAGNVNTVYIGNIVQSSPIDGIKNTYAAAVAGLVTAVTATDIFTITGSATKTVKVTSISISGTTTAGSGVGDNIVLIKRSSANSGGVSSSATTVPYDSNNPAATASVLSYTVNPTSLGTSVGTIKASRLNIENVATPSTPVMWTFGDRPAQAIVLRGTSQVLAVNLSSTTIAGSVFDIDIEWTEE